MAASLVINGTEPHKDRDAYRIEQYSKIVQFGNRVIAGHHPTIKVPQGLGPSQSVPVAARGASRAATHDESSTALQSSVNSLKPALPSIGARHTEQPRPSLPANVDINPIFLEKSDSLVRAELQLQRKRLESLLKDEAEQSRLDKVSHGEAGADIDLPDILAKALTLVQASATPLPTTTDDNLTASNEAASDSFDENTFYSSQHDTPDSRLTSRIRNESEEARALDLAPSPAQVDARNPVATRSLPANVAQGNQAARSAVAQAPHESVIAHATRAAPQASIVPGLNNYPEQPVPPNPPHSTFAERAPTEATRAVVPEARNVATVNGYQRPTASYADIHPPSPLVRDEDVIPLAPQRSRPAEPIARTTRGTPAQIAALRGEASAATSPDTSSPGAKASDKKKGKKKKRKADRQATGLDFTPYIKPEPRSPSPLAAPSYARPNKRQRHSLGQPIEPGSLDARYDPSSVNVLDDEYHPQSYAEDRFPAGYRGGPYQQRAASPVVIADSGYGHGYVDEPRRFHAAHVGNYVSPRSSTIQYLPGGEVVNRPASRIVLDDPYQQQPRSHHEAYEMSRVSSRQQREPLMAPPPPARIIVDQYGREYIEPSHVPARHSVAPAAREQTIMYERAPTRAVSRQPPPGSYGDGSIVYANPPPYTIARRVVTQPEYMSQELRERSYREYSTARGPGAAGNVVHVMGTPNRRLVEDPAKEYVSRASSVRPVETVRYEMPPDYGRLQGPRPEAPMRASVHPESHGDFVQPYVRGYSARPAEQHLVPPEYGLRPVQRYYEPHMPSSRDLAYVPQQPPAAPDPVYPVNGGRPMYQ
ncbi:hypothetical protein S40288_06128 [Stachybotrys chartarum IBT 40288]|nr:hypothetical protein S40288_06128 [Stachybotrys chartarum IBT 40288]